MQQQFLPIPDQQFPSLFEQAIQLVQQPMQQCNSNSIDDDIEALVNSRAEDLVDSSMDDDTSSLSGISTSSTCFSPQSEMSGSTDDSDWTPKSVDQFNDQSKGSAASKSKEPSKRKPRLNRRSVEDRQSRKKEQNKNAANRYRMKKKIEIETILDVERDLTKRRDNLRNELAEVSREEKYLKSLLRELLL